MAKDDHDLDDFDLDDELDIPEFDESGLDGPSTDRKPVERVAGGFLEGIKSTSLDKGFQRKVIQTSMPDGYGKAFDDLDEAARLGQDLYDSAASAMRPYEKTIKKIGRKVTEKADRFLPEGLSNKLKEMTEPDNGRADEQVDAREAEITANLAGIFEAQAQADAEQKASDETRENVREVVEEQRHRTELDVLKTMRSGMDRLVAYQDRVTASYQKKSLELQFRQLFVARDQYTLMEAHVKENKLQLQAISKNTALPEFVKLRGSEAAKQMLRQKAFGGAMDAIGRGSQNFMGNVREKAMAKLNQFTSSVGEGLQGIGDAMEMTEGSGIQLDGLEMGGQMASGVLMEEGVSRYGRRFGETLAKIPGFSRMGDRLEYFSDNKEDAIRSALNRIAQKDDGGLGSDFDLMSEEEQERRREELENRTTLDKARDALDRGTTGMQANLARMALEFLGPEASADRRFSQGEVGNLATEVVPYTSLTDRSITEIIPGLLTNILHEAEMIRTGDNDIERRVYDANARTFRREGDVQRDLMQTVMPDDRKQAIREDLDEIVNEVDADGVLSEDARNAFRRQVLEDLSAGRGFRVDRYTDATKLSGEYGEDSAREISELMQSRFLDESGEFRGDDDQAQATRNRVSRKFRNASTTLPNYQEAVANIYSAYGPEMLREMGLLQDTGLGGNSLDTKGILDNFIQDGGLTAQGLESRTAQMAERTNVREEPLFEAGPFPTDPREMVVDTSPLPEESDDQAMERIESSLSTMQSMLGRFVEVATGRSYEEQFKNVLKAIGELNVKEHFDISNGWLEKIYKLLIDCCGPGGGGPSGGGPTSPQGGPGPQGSMWERTSMRALDAGQAARARGEMLWQQGQNKFQQLGVRDKLTQGYGQAKNRLTSLTQDERVQNVVNKGSEYLSDAQRRAMELKGQIPEAMQTAKERVSQGVDKAKNLTADDIRTNIVSGVDRLKAVEAPEIDLRQMSSQGYDALTSNLVKYGDRARSAASDLRGRVTESDIGQRAAETFSRVRGEASHRLAPAIEKGQDLASQIKEGLTPLEKALDPISQSVGRMKERATATVGKVRDRAKGVDIQNMKDEILSMFEQSKDVDLSALKAQIDNLVDMEDFRLADQPERLMDKSREYAGVVGDGVSRARENIQQRFSGEGSMASRAGQAYGDMTRGIEDIYDRVTAGDFDLAGYFNEEAANDPRMLLAALQKASEDTLKKLEEADLATKAQTVASDVANGARSILGALKAKVGEAKLPMRRDNVQSEGSADALQSSDFWSNAWEMLTNLKGHMDEKTGQIIEAMGNLGGGEGQPGMAKRLGSKVMDGVGGIASYYGKAFSGMGSLLKGGGRGAGSVLKGLGGRLGGMIRGKGKAAKEEPIVDIYLEGQESPVMLARDLRKGLYFDRESLEPVQRISEIQGAVIDNEENTVVTDEDVAEGRLYTLDGKEVKPGILSRLGKGYLNYATMPTRMLFTGAKKIGQYLVDKAKEPQDIYVKGEDTPRLLAVVMKNGGYLSKATQEPIMSPQDIDGAVINHEGQTLLTEAELRNPGIVNARGKAIRAVGSGLGELAKKAGGMLGSYYKGVFNAGKSVIGGIGNILGFGEGKEGGGLFGGGGKKQVEWLEKIYGLLDERIEKPKKTREGSWKQLMGDDEEGDVDTKDPRAMADPEKGMGGGLMSLLAGGLGGLFDKLNPFGDGGVGVDVDLPMGRDGRDRERAKDRRNRTRGKKGMLGKLWSGAKSLGRGALSVGKAALPLAGSALALGGKALAATAGAVGSVLSAPVVLTAAAVAAVGVGGYLLYKNFANDPEGPLHRFRLMQYGVDPDSGDPVARINALEEKLSDEVSLGGGQPTINQGVDAQELLEICGIDAEDQEAVHRWSNWFQQRFKPVFLSHMAVLNSLSSNTALSDVDDDLDESLKTTYLKRVHFKEGTDAPYRATSYIPFDELESLAGPAEVQAEYDKSMEAVAKEKEKSESGSASRSSSDPSKPGPVTRPKTEVERLNAGVERRKKDSPTMKDMGDMSKEEYERLSSTPEGLKILERRRKTQESGGPEMSVVADNTKPKAGAIPASEGDILDDGSSESRRRSRAWAAASAEAAGEEDSVNDRRVEERRRRDQRVSAQTESQTQKNSAMLNSAVNRMVSILSDSHGVQRNIDKNLTEMNKMLKAKYKKELEEDDKQEEQAKDDGFFSSLFGDDEEERRKMAPWMTSR